MNLILAIVTVLLCQASHDCAQNAAMFVECMTGTAIHVPHEGACLYCDLKDFAAFQLAFTGP
ncbi:unnamed protein product [marine sediment metagenome]|uniref:Uncharacterized protein n=1 Tax=marine sediment metagenome TaxID=412755 RepID=X0XJY9_9ZZZZ